MTTNTFSGHFKNDQVNSLEDVNSSCGWHNWMDLDTLKFRQVSAKLSYKLVTLYPFTCTTVKDEHDSSRSSVCLLEEVINTSELVT